MGERSALARLVAVGITILVAGCGSPPVVGDNEVWPGDQSHIDCCVATRLPSPDGSKALVFQPDADEKVHVRLSAGWLRQYGVTLLEGPASASWAPDGKSFFISDGGGSGQTSAFRLFRTPDNGDVVELTSAHRGVVSAYRAHVQCPAEAFDPEVWGLGWSPDGRRAYVLAQSSIHEPCGRSDAYMVMAVATDDGRLLEQFDTAEATARFADLIPANVRGVTAP